MGKGKPQNPLLGTPPAADKARKVGGERTRHRKKVHLATSLKTPSPIARGVTAKASQLADVANSLSLVHGQSDEDLITGLFSGNVQNFDKLGRFVVGGADGMDAFNYYLSGDRIINWPLISAMSSWCEATAQHHHQAAYKTFLNRANTIITAALQEAVAGLTGTTGNAGIVPAVQTVSAVLFAIDASNVALMDQFIKQVVDADIVPILVRNMVQSPLTPLPGAAQSTRRTVLQSNEALGMFLCSCIAWLAETKPSFAATVAPLNETISGIIDSSLSLIASNALEEPSPLDKMFLLSSDTIDPKCALWTGLPALTAAWISIHRAISTNPGYDAELLSRSMSILAQSDKPARARTDQGFGILARLSAVSQSKKRTKEDEAWVTELQESLGVDVQAGKVSGEKYLDEFEMKVNKVTEILHDNLRLSSIPCLPILMESAMDRSHEIQCLPEDMIVSVIEMTQVAIQDMVFLLDHAFDMSIGDVLVPGIRRVRCFLDLISLTLESSQSSIEVCSKVHAIATVLVKLTTTVSRNALEDPDLNLVVLTLSNDVTFLALSLSASLLMRAGGQDMAETLKKLAEHIGDIHGFIRQGVQVFGDFLAVRVPNAILLKCELGQCGDLAQFETVLGDQPDVFDGRVGVVVTLVKLVSMLFLSAFFSLSLKADKEMSPTGPSVAQPSPTSSTATDSPPHSPLIAEDRALVLSHLLNTWLGVDAQEPAMQLMKTGKKTPESFSLDGSRSLSLVVQAQVLDLMMTHYADENDPYFIELRSSVPPSGPDALAAMEVASLIASRLKVDRMTSDRNHAVTRALLSIPSLFGGDYIEDVQINFKQASAYKAFLQEFLGFAS